MKVKTKVLNAPEGLVLKHCGPCSYRPILADTTAVEWKDEVIVRVTSVNHARKEMAVELVPLTGQQNQSLNPGGRSGDGRTVQIVDVVNCAE